MKIILSENQLSLIIKKTLNEDFKTQTQKYIQQGFSQNIVKKYLDDFNEIRNKKYREARDIELPGLSVPTGEPRFNVDNYKTFKELEILVDYVAGQRKFGSQNFEDFKIDGKSIFENNDVEIYYADTPRACIHYKGEGNYSWCISRSDSSNMFYNYRLNEEDEPSFYFVKRKNVIKNDKYHFFVIQALKLANEEDKYTKIYKLTSAINDGDFLMSWQEILEKVPELNGLRKIFQPKPLTPKEREKIKLYRNKLSDDDFARLPYKEKEFYIDIFVTNNGDLTYNQFKILPEDLKNKYIGLSPSLSDEQFELIKNNKNLLKRYVDITNKNFDTYTKMDDSDDFDKRFNEIELLLVHPNKFNSLTSYKLYHILKKFENSDKIFEYIIENKTNITPQDIVAILQTTNKPIKFSKLIGLNKVRNVLYKNLEQLKNIIKYSKNKDGVTKLIKNLVHEDDLLYYL